MSDPNRCERCGSALPEAGVLRKLCPRCLVELGLEPASDLRNSEIIPTGQVDTNVAARAAAIRLQLIGEGVRHIDTLADALEVEASQRAAFVDQACEGDGELRRIIDALLASSAFTTAVQALAYEAQSMIGRELGHYRILALLGAGGMGLVWKAKDTKLARDVAIKVLRPDKTSDP